MRPEPSSYEVTALQAVRAWITSRSSRQIIVKAKCRSVLGSDPSQGDPKKIIAVSSPMTDIFPEQLATDLIVDHQYLMASL